MSHAWIACTLSHADHRLMSQLMSCFVLDIVPVALCDCGVVCVCVPLHAHVLLAFECGFQCRVGQCLANSVNEPISMMQHVWGLHVCMHCIDGDCPCSLVGEHLAVCRPCMCADLWHCNPKIIHVRNIKKCPQTASCASFSSKFTTVSWFAPPSPGGPTLLCSCK